MAKSVVRLVEFSVGDSFAITKQTTAVSHGPAESLPFVKIAEGVTSLLSGKWGRILELSCLNPVQAWYQSTWPQATKATSSG